MRRGVEWIGHYRPYKEVHEVLLHRPLRYMDTGRVRMGTKLKSDRDVHCIVIQA